MSELAVVHDRYGIDPVADSSPGADPGVIA
jgi:hypothetical protein